MNFLNVNLIAVIAAAAASMIIGSLWYSSLLFGKKWMEIKNYTPDDMKAAPGALALAGLKSLVTAFVLALLFRGINVITIWDALTVSFMIWAGFQLTTEANDVIFGEKPFMLCLLDSANQLASILTMGIILTLLR